MIFVPIIILFIITIYRIRRGMFDAFLILVATKSIVDIFWNYEIFGLSILSFQGVLIAIIFFPMLKNISQIPKYWKNTLVIYLISISIGLLWGIILEPFKSLELIVINVNIYLSFFLIPFFIKNKEQLKKLLSAIIICGVTPILISLFQIQTGVIFTERDTVGLSRYVGFYHDAFPVRFYGFFTLFSIFVYQYIFDVKGVIIKLLFAFLIISSFISIYFVFSKAALMIFFLWSFSFILLSKSKINFLFLIVIGLGTLFLIYGNSVLLNVEQLFVKEIGFQNNTLADNRYVLAGRGFIWESYINKWIDDFSIISKIFGLGVNKPVHNEFLRILIVNGIFGLILFIIFLLRIMNIILNCSAESKIFAIMLFSMYFVDTIGLVPGVYYYYNILVWGMIGLIYYKPHLFKKHNS